MVTVAFGKLLNVDVVMAEQILLRININLDLFTCCTNFLMLKSFNQQDTRKTSVSDETRKSTVPTSIPAGYTGRRFSVYVGNLTWVR